MNWLASFLMLAALPLWAEVGGDWSATEREAVDEGMAQFDVQLVQNPEGKKIGQIFYYTLKPFTKSDGFLQIFDKAHVDSKNSAVAQNMSINPGDLYDTILVTQSTQALQDPRFRSLVVIAPVISKTHPSQGSVDLLVVTRDVWSLRLETDFQLTDKVVNELYFNLVENNLFGLNKSLGTYFDLRQAQMRVGAQYVDPHLFGTWNTLNIEQGIIFNKAGNHYEGLLGNYSLSYPLYSPSSQWGYSLTANYIAQPVYLFQGGNVRTIAISEGDQVFQVKQQYRYFSLDGSAVVTRSFGDLIKNNIFWGYGLKINRPTLFADFSYDAYVAEQFRQKILPQDDLQSFLIAGYDYFWNTYATFYDYNTFVLSEIYRTGPRLTVTANLAGKPVLYSDNNFVRGQVKLSYLTDFADNGLLNMSLQGQTRYQQGQWINNYVSAEANIATPKFFGGGRLVVDAFFQGNFADKNNSYLYLGGNKGLRGMPSDYYQGQFFLRGNVEYRSLSTPIWIARVGGVLFYDVGSAFNDFSRMHLSHDVGVGLRILLMQFNRGVIRLDVAVPLSGPIAGLQYITPTIGFGQAF